MIKDPLRMTRIHTIYLMLIKAVVLEAAVIDRYQQNKTANTDGQLDNLEQVSPQNSVQDAPNSTSVGEIEHQMMCHDNSSNWIISTGKDNYQLMCKGEELALGFRCEIINMDTFSLLKVIYTQKNTRHSFSCSTPRPSDNIKSFNTYGIISKNWGPFAFLVLAIIIIILIVKMINRIDHDGS